MSVSTLMPDDLVGGLVDVNIRCYKGWCNIFTVSRFEEVNPVYISRFVLCLHLVHAVSTETFSINLIP